MNLQLRYKLFKNPSKKNKAENKAGIVPQNILSKWLEHFCNSCNPELRLRQRLQPPHNLDYRISGDRKMDGWIYGRASM